MELNYSLTPKRMHYVNNKLPYWNLIDIRGEWWSNRGSWTVCFKMGASMRLFFVVYALWRMKNFTHEHKNFSCPFLPWEKKTPLATKRIKFTILLFVLCSGPHRITGLSCIYIILTKNMDTNSRAVCEDIGNSEKDEGLFLSAYWKTSIVLFLNLSWITIHAHRQYKTY